MPPQHVEIAETIIALKRALRREKEAPSEQPISSATNRGNKLKRGANYVHAGSIPYRYNAHGYKERIEHAGYQRYILERNPRRYNEFGDELDDSESDEEADADADDENPYSDIRLEEILRPLVHPAELAVHPTLSLPYLDSALPEMVKSTEEQLRQERANLWRAKTLHRQFIGDESWMPAGGVEASDDWDLFEPQKESTIPGSGKKRKRDEDEMMTGYSPESHNHVEAQDMTTGADTAQVVNGEAQSEKYIAGKDLSESGISENGQLTATGNPDRQDPRTDADVNMTDTNEIKSNGIHTKAESPDVGVNGDRTIDDEHKNAERAGDDTSAQEPSGDQSNDEDQAGDGNEATPPPPSRRITRALAAADTSNAATPPFSPTGSTSSSIASTLLQPAPLFLLPPSLTLSHSHASSHHNLPLHVAHSGLPIDEILETRRLLGMYIQKQEETIRGLEGVLGKLIKAKRMKDRVWEWCKAEGHVGEWSDGEDWVDEEAWGLRGGELRKGRDEEEVEAQQAEESRKGKRRRGRE